MEKTKTKYFINGKSLLDLKCVPVSAPPRYITYGVLARVLDLM